MIFAKKSIRCFLVIATIFFSQKEIFAQSDLQELKWNAGSLLLDDSTELKGFVQNNEKFRMIKFKKQLSDTAETSFQEKSVLSMQYFDSTLSRNRNFFTLKVEDEGSLYRGPVLFEVILVMKEFVVLSRKYGVLPEGNSKKKNNDASKIEFDQVEKIFLSGEDSKAELLLLTVLLDGKKSRKQDLPIEPFFDWDVMRKFMGPRWDEVRAYIKKNQLNVYRKSDLLTVLEFYQRLNN